MDPQQSALPLQLHGNSFAMNSGQVPKRSAGYFEGGGGGGRGQEAELNQLNLTSSARVSSRSNPGEQLQCPLEPLGRCHAKGKMDIQSRSCSLLTICRSGVMFPWMNPRTSDSEQSDKHHDLDTTINKEASVCQSGVEESTFLSKSAVVWRRICQPEEGSVSGGSERPSPKASCWSLRRSFTTALTCVVLGGWRWLLVCISPTAR